MEELRLLNRGVVGMQKRGDRVACRSKESGWKALSVWSRRMGMRCSDLEEILQAVYASKDL